MNRCTRCILTLLAGVAIGGVSVGVYDRHEWKKRDEQWGHDINVAVKNTSDAFASECYQWRIIDHVNTLIMLRRGETNRIVKNMESNLSFELDGLLGSTSPEALLSDTNASRILNRVAAYKRLYPFGTGNEQIDAAVEGLLTNFDAEVDLRLTNAPVPLR